MLTSGRPTYLRVAATNLDLGEAMHCFVLLYLMLYTRMPNIFSRIQIMRQRKYGFTDSVLVFYEASCFLSCYVKDTLSSSLTRKMPWTNLLVPTTS